MTERVPEKIKKLYDYLPDEYVAYNLVEPTSIILNVSPDRAREYLKMLEMFNMVRRVDTFRFEKIKKGHKKLTLEDLGDLQTEKE